MSVITAATTAQAREALQISSPPDAAVILGSGWAGTVAELGQCEATVKVADLTGMTPPAAEGHIPLIHKVRTSGGATLLVFQGRTHLYERLGVDPVVGNVHLAHALGIGTVVLTNASGGVNPEYAVGDIVVVTDHINLTALSPLAPGEFVDLTGCYTPDLIAQATLHGPWLRAGVYAQLPGPHYETPAENRYLRTIGADIVGMSTALEAISAAAAGMQVLAFSIVSAPAPGSDQTIEHEDIMAVVAGRAAVLAPVISRCAEHIMRTSQTHPQ